MRIASLDVEVPVYRDISDLNLSRGAGWIDGTAAPNTAGNMAIAAHRDQYFHPLKDIIIGDILELESLTGQGQYRVSRIDIVEPEEAIVVDGKKWARFEAEFQRDFSDGAITSDFRNNRGRSLGSVRMMPARDQRVLLDGRNYRFSDLQRGQILNFYVPEEVYAFTTTAGAPTEQMVQIVEPTQPQATPRSQTRMAQVEPARTTRPNVLPETAGSLALFLLGGILLLLVGTGMTLRRSTTRV